MIFIVAKFSILPDLADSWIEAVADFTAATRSEAGNEFFEWSRSVDSPNEFMLVEAFDWAEAGAEHVNSEHFKTAMEQMRKYVADTPRILHIETHKEGWDQMAELRPAERA